VRKLDLPPNVTLNMPPFLNGKYQLSLEEEVVLRAFSFKKIKILMTVPL
jgi:hypothetical protein